MKTTVTPEPELKRGRDSGNTRAALIAAARELFEERGYSGATVRAIGKRAGVDPALIARYFDNKEGLYIATLADESKGFSPRFAGLTPEEIVSLLFDRWDEPGPSPFARALSSATIDPRVLTQVKRAVRTRLREPLAEGLRKGEPDQATLESEILIALVVGVSITRANGTLPAIAQAEPEEIHAVLERFARSSVD